MAIDIRAERLLSLPQLARQLPGKPHPSTVWRWHLRGVNGIKLETTLVGGKRFTSVEAGWRFLDRVNAADPGTTSAPSADRQRRLEKAECELANAGI